MKAAWMIVLPALCAALAWAGAAPQETQGVAVGETPTYSFRSDPFNSMGAQSLEDLRGRPVLVEFWGHR